eukprot:TRINITY_DN946_c0_g1_i2.p1 TRINITY_DN946_c0_g1~~TRINITY_DN946_c0_g1_i2.p1  ORF type:complete len:413 (-),score=129.26 TRINITY_DN946_c0_g1_i2:765-2003(-)
MESLTIQVNVLVSSGYVLLHSVEMSFGKRSVSLVLPDLPVLCGIWVGCDAPSVQLEPARDAVIRPALPAPPAVPAAPEFQVELIDKKVAPEMAPLLRRVREGLQARQRPERIPHGVNGTYFLKDKSGSKIAIFKPTDEEFCGSDGSDASDDSSSFGLLPGETAVREAAAYRVAREHPNPAFHLVPPTGLVRITAPRATFVPAEPNATEPVVKTGSLQEFVYADGDSEGCGAGKFVVGEVHKIGVLDLQIVNCDRNGQNVLVLDNDDGSCSLVPIDHGFSMPAGLSLGFGRFAWLDFPASLEPFSVATPAHIESIPVERVLKALADDLHVRPECLVGVRVSHAWLQRAAAAGLTLFEIGDAVCRRNDCALPSDLELVYEAARLSVPADDDAAFQDALYRKIDQLIEDVLAQRR